MCEEEEGIMGERWVQLHMVNMEEEDSRKQKAAERKLNQELIEKYYYKVCDIP